MQKANGIKVLDRRRDYMDFIVASDSKNLYRYESFTGKMRKLFGLGDDGHGKAIRGKERIVIEELAKTVYENNLPFAIVV